MTKNGETSDVLVRDLLICVVYPYFTLVAQQELDSFLQALSQEQLLQHVCLVVPTSLMAAGNEMEHAETILTNKSSPQQ